MKIKRYIASNQQEALIKVKMDLGSEAVILSTRKIRQKGIKWLFGKPMVEVVAAVEEKQEVPAMPFALQPKQKLSQQVQQSDIEKRLSGMEEMIKKLCQQVEKKYTHENTQEADGQEQKTAIKVFYENLLNNDVEEEFAKKAVDIVESKIGSSTGFNECISILTNLISTTFGKSKPIKLREDGQPTVVAFVGPTGVGKTTTLAKIAADFTLNARKKVGLITADTYRIAAVEQLKTYADILGIPVCVVYSPEDVSHALEELKDKDLILIDTAGRSHKNKEQIDELKNFLDAFKPDEVYLVLSAASSYKSCCEIIDVYNFINDYKLIFTKTDEAASLGVILNVKLKSKKTLAYITMGQNVPDDIEMFNPDKIAKMLIGRLA